MEELEHNSIDISEERVVHAKYNGIEVTRYEHKWFLESVPIQPPRNYWEPEKKKDEQPPKKKKVSLKEAAASTAKGVRAAWMPSNKAWPSGFQVFFGQEGGAEFDKIVKTICPTLYIEIQYFDLGDDHEFMGMKCPGCQDWLHIGDKQIGGKDCVHHDRNSGGCGFHGYVIGAHAGYVPDLGDKLKEGIPIFV